jgi:hypothetical protein
MKVNQCTPVYVALYSEVTVRSRANSLKSSRQGAVHHASESEAASFIYFFPFPFSFFFHRLRWGIDKLSGDKA